MKQFEQIPNITLPPSTPMWTIPIQRTWTGLTDADRLELAAAQHSWEDLLIVAEAKLKEKNA